MKFLVDPFCWYLLLQMLGLTALQGGTRGFNRAMIRALTIMTLLFAISSTAIVGNGLLNSLILPETNHGAIIPEYIFVLGGGYILGAQADEDILNSESERRVAHAVTVWRRYPRATIVFSGAAYLRDGVRGHDRMTQLMSAGAGMRGVPEQFLLQEPNSINTREHPIEALKLRGVMPSTPIAVVTSDWHIRRARREFCRSFEAVLTSAVPARIHSVSWQDFIPDPGALNFNTALLREWVGSLWYEILNRSGNDVTGNPLCAV